MHCSMERFNVVVVDPKGTHTKFVPTPRESAISETCSNASCFLDGERYLVHTLA
jgi:hypothetical protein